MKSFHFCSPRIFSLYPLRHATTIFAVLMALLLVLILPCSAAQNEGLPTSPPQTQKSDADGFSFDPRLRLNPSMLIILVCLLSAFFIMGCVCVSIRHCSQRHTAHVFRDDRALSSRRRFRQVPRRGLDSSIIDGFPIFQYSDVKELKLGKGALECAVCLNEFENDETLRLIPNCSHVFHPDCIDAWLASHVTCPVCRANLGPISEDDQDDCGDQGPDPGTQDSFPELPISIPTRSDLSNPVLEANNLGIHIHIGSPEPMNPRQTNAEKAAGIDGKYPRSYSTGHAMVPLDKNCERFTLRLPEDVRTRLINSELSRARSCVAFTRVRSSTKGFRRNDSGGGGRTGSTNRGRLDMVARSEESGASIFPAAGTEMEGVSGEKPASTSLRNLLRPARSLRTPLERFFSGAEKTEFDGERSFHKLMSDDHIHTPV